jgi:hypothetical protein
LNSGHELEIRIWDEPDISISPGAFEAIAFCELLMRSVKKQLARSDSVEALGREHHRLLQVRQDSGRIGMRIGFATSVESNE